MAVATLPVHAMDAGTAPVPAAMLVEQAVSDGHCARRCRGVEALTSHAPMAIFSRAQFATPVSHVTKDNILNTLNKVGVNFQRTKKSYALFWFFEPFA